MEDRNNLPYFFLGIGVGLAVGMLFAPKSGEETRAMLKERADDSRDFLKQKSGEFASAPATSSSADARP